MDLYEKVKDISNDRGISIRHVEQLAGFGNGTIGKWKVVSPRLKSIVKVAAALGIPVSLLLEGEQHDQPRSK